MNIRRQKAEAVAKKYMQTDTLLTELGSGAEGFVFPTLDATAVKIFQYEEKFRREARAYARLRMREITEILGVAVPRMVKCNSELLVIEMTLVEPPFLLDFAQASIDKPFEFAEQEEDAWWAEKRSDFGDQFERARDIFYALQQASGIYYYDLAPRNLNLSQDQS